MISLASRIFSSRPLLGATVALKRTVTISEDVGPMVNTVMPEDLRSIFRSFYIHDALQPRKAVIGVEDARIAMLCGNKHLLVEDGKRRW